VVGVVGVVVVVAMAAVAVAPAGMLHQHRPNVKTK